MRLLLDAHLPVALVGQLRERGVDVEAISTWLDSSYSSASDETILTVALQHRRVLVTYDCRTIPMLLKEWAEAGQHHAGIILVDGRTIRPNDIGSLLRALCELVSQRGQDDWLDRVVYLRRSVE